TLMQKSKRVDMPFVPVNCGALAEHLVESELFGHRKGAFTGADRDHKGLFEVADGGTLFLDEVGELNKNIQVKLLRFLESGEIRRVGDTKPYRAEVRVLCAKTFISASTPLRFDCRPCANDAPTFPISPGTFWPAPPSGRWNKSRSCSRP